MSSKALYVIICSILVGSCKKKETPQPFFSTPSFTRMYAGAISSTKNWHHEFYFNSVFDKDDMQQQLNDTSFAFKMQDDSTIHYETSLKVIKDDVMYFESKYSRPYSFRASYNCRTGEMSFTTSSGGGNYSAGDIFTSF
jgi:hypothetical protein